MRALGCGVLDVATLGVSEVATNPAEAAVGKDKMRIRVCYDPKQNVVYSEQLKVGKEAKRMPGLYPVQYKASEWARCAGPCTFGRLAARSATRPCRGQARAALRRPRSARPQERPLLDGAVLFEAVLTSRRCPQM